MNNINVNNGKKRVYIHKKLKRNRKGPVKLENVVNVEVPEEKDYFKDIKPPETETEEVNSEVEDKTEGGEEVYNKIRAWREITDKEENKKDQEESLVKRENRKRVEFANEYVNDMLSKKDENNDDLEDHVEECKVPEIHSESESYAEFEGHYVERNDEDEITEVDEIKYEPFQAPEPEYSVNGDQVSKEEFEEAVNSYYESTANETPVDEGLELEDESVFLGTVITKDDLYTEAVKDVINTMNRQNNSSSNKVAYIWVVDENCMYYYNNTTWVKDETNNDTKEVENNEYKEQEEEYQFVYEPETEEDDGDDLGYTSLITETGEELTEDQIESLDGVGDNEFFEKLNQEVLEKLAEESKGYKETPDEIQYVDLDDLGELEIAELEPAEELPTLEEIYADVDEDDFIIESEEVDYKEELENDTEDYEDTDVEDDVEVWDDEFEDEDIETVIEDDIPSLVSDILKIESESIKEAVDNEIMDFIENKLDDEEVPFYDEEMDDDVEVWDDEFEDEDIETVIEDDEVPFYDEDDEEEYYDLDDAAEYEEAFEDPYFEENEDVEESEDKTEITADMVEYIVDVFNNNLDIAAITEKGEELPNKLVKTDVDSSKAVLHLETMDDEGYSVTDLISIVKYILIKLNKTITTDGIDDEILFTVMERLSEAQLWLEKWSNR